jgi:hypothetical protein
VGACPSVRRIDPTEAAALELPARFLAPVDEPLDVPALTDESAAQAGVVAFALHALAVAGLAPGDVAVWLGQSPVAVAGRALAEAAGAHAFQVREALEDVAGLRAEIASAVAGAGLAHGAQKRILLLTEGAPWPTALALADPGSLFVALGPGAGTLPALALPAEARLQTLAAYHPDFLPEAFAALRRGELALPHRLAPADETPGDQIAITPLR